MPPSRIATSDSPTRLRSTTRARYAPAGPTSQRPGSSSTRVPAVAASPASRSAIDASRAAEHVQVERRLVVAVRDPEPATGIDQAEREAGLGCDGGRELDRRLHVCRQDLGIEQVRRPEGVHAPRLEPRRGDGVRRGGSQVGLVHAELAGAGVADDPDPLGVRIGRRRQPEEDRLDPARGLGDRGQPAQLADATRR